MVSPCSRSDPYGSSSGHPVELPRESLEGGCCSRQSETHLLPSPDEATGVRGRRLFQLAKDGEFGRRDKRKVLHSTTKRKQTIERAVELL